MVKKLYSDFDSSITIRSSKGKTFDEHTFKYKILNENPQIKGYSKAIEEIVILKHGEKWINANLYGVEKSFLEISKMQKHIVDGHPELYTSSKIPLAIAGAGLLQRLQAYANDQLENSEFVEIYFPLRDAKMRIGSTPFNNEFIQLAGSYNYNREVNLESIVVPISFAQKELNYEKDITCIYVNVPKESNITKVQRMLQEQLGKNWRVKTQFEKNELIYKTSKTEKLIVIGILLFVFIIAAFNLITALIMSILEKKRDISTLCSLGMTKKSVFKIFFLNGMMVAFKGIIYGLIIGFGICLLQLKFGLLKMPNANGEFFPIQIRWMDGLTIFMLISILSAVTTYFPVKFIIRRL